eukprot:gb/GEZN01006501.1/.p1 GENE.gb/GEZN01006501.1/~~gb/GEZN01006501.1/.p1  ORF type:complete len:502 (-),score=44.33 gb/GEZN01006501.1/:117-1622(-)
MREAAMAFNVGLAFHIFNQVVGWLLMASLASSLDFLAFRRHMRSPLAVVIGMCCQFVLIPFVCFLTCVVTEIPLHLAIGLQIICCCPGGINSNALTFCFGADLALSVAMTSCSSLLAVGMLPLNLFIYVTALTYVYPPDKQLIGGSGINVDYQALVLTSCVLLSGLAVGLRANLTKSTIVFRLLGTLATIGIILMVIVTPIINSNSGQPVWMYPFPVWIATCIPPLIGYILGISISRYIGHLARPSCVAVGIETAFQNVLFATVIISASFPKALAAEVLGVPLMYTCFCSLTVILLSLVMHHYGWTKDDRSEHFNICMMFDRYLTYGSKDGEHKQDDQSVCKPSYLTYGFKDGQDKQDDQSVSRRSYPYSADLERSSVSPASFVHLRDESDGPKTISDFLKRAMSESDVFKPVKQVVWVREEIYVTEVADTSILFDRKRTQSDSAVMISSKSPLILSSRRQGQSVLLSPSSTHAEPADLDCSYAQDEDSPASPSASQRMVP